MKGNAELIGPRAPRGLKPRIVYLVRREGLSSVFASQVLSRMAAVSEAGFQVDIVVLAPLGEWARADLRRRWKAIVASAPAALAGRLFHLPLFPSRVEWPAAEVRILAPWLRRRYGRSIAPVILHCRNATVTWMALHARQAVSGSQVVFDCRGLLRHELLYAHNHAGDTGNMPAAIKANTEVLSGREKMAFHGSDAVLCVSRAMADHLVSEHGEPRARRLVVPCCVDMTAFERATEHRDEVRRSLGVEGRFVVTYCGSLAPYQLPHRSLRLFRQVCHIDSRAHFLAITTQPAAMKAAAADVGVSTDRMTIVSVPHKEVASYLAAADVGLLLRERTVVNIVASPVKFGEYLASGVPVIISDGIGECSEMVQSHQVGVVLDPDATENQGCEVLRAFIRDYRSTPMQWRMRCRQTARDHLTFSRFIGQMSDMYLVLSEAATRALDGHRQLHAARPA